MRVACGSYFVTMYKRDKYTWSKRKMKREKGKIMKRKQELIELNRKGKEEQKREKGKKQQIVLCLKTTWNKQRRTVSKSKCSWISHQEHDKMVQRISFRVLVSVESLTVVKYVSSQFN